ncbi:MAG: hypothetical protein A2V85_06130 [Chloroflexi bacterium RBG_16_72_14]|nr:MAG: hypothetical protein A2V85_06130 [Chloroflexi bacterium RBG_16_72_14]
MTAAAAAVADATTERVATARRDRAVAAPHRPSNRHGLAALAGLALVVTVSLFALGSIASRFLATGATPLPDDPAASSTAIVGVASPSSSSSPSASQQSSPSEPPEPTENPLDAAIADLRAAIEGARGGGDLKGKDVNDLFKDVADIERAIADGNVDAAGEKARKLEDRVRGLIDKDEVGGEAGDRLLAAATTLARLLASG